MTRTLIYPMRKKVQDIATVQLPSLANQLPTQSSLDGSRANTASCVRDTRLSSQRSSATDSRSLDRAASVVNFVQDCARSIAKGRPRKRKLQRSTSNSALFSAPRRGRRNGLVPVARADRITYSRWFIQPRATWKVRWDIWIGFIIAYSVILIPYRIGFGIELAAWEQYLNYLFDSSFAVDVILNFFTGYFEEDILVFELQKVRKRYLRSWFLFDVASTIPLEQFMEVMTIASSSLLTLKLIRIFRLFRLLKLMRLLRLKRTMEALQVDALNAHVLQTIKSLLMIIFIIHLVACGWYMFYTWDPTGKNWVTHSEPEGFEHPYLVSFYWVSNTMMSVGYGDIYGVTDGERLYSIFVACLGSISVGMIIANIQMLTENYNPRGNMLKQKLQDAKEFLIKRSIPRRLRQRVISQFEFHWSRRTVFDEGFLLQQFPKNLQYEILAASMESFVKIFSFFGMTSVEFFVFAIPRLRPIVLGPGQVLVDAESVWEELYFLTSGIVETVQSNLVVGSLSPGDICGIEYLVNARRRYTHTFRSALKTEVYAMYSNDLLEAIGKCPVAHKYLEDLAVIVGERYEECAKRGRRALQRKRSERTIRREAFTRGGPYLHKRRRKSNSTISLHTVSSDLINRMDTSVAGDDRVTHWSVIRHYAKARIAWDIVMGILVSITAITVPFRIAFNVQDVLAFYATDRIADVLFVIDVVLSFCTTYVDDMGVEIVDRYEIRRHYLKTTFFVDVASTIPFDFIVEAAATGNIFASLRLIRTLKLIKLLRLMRLSKLIKRNSQWMAEFDINVDTVRLLKLLAPVMIIAHYVGCFWYYISADRPADDAWWGIENLHFEDPDSILSKYIASIYWAITTMTTVGFGDIYPVNNLEKGFCILVLIGGTTLFAYVVGTVIEVASNSKSLMNREHKMVQRVNAYIKERGVSSEFVAACQEHLRFVDAEKTFFVENSLFDALSYSLRNELVLHLNGGIVSKVRFFDKKPKWFLTLILPRLVPQFFMEGDILIYQDNPVSGIFFIMNGAVIAKTRHYVPVPQAHATTPRGKSQSISPIIADHHGSIAKIYEGEFFGYKEVLTETAARYNLYAMRPTGTYLLPRECLDEFEAKYPRVMDEIRSLIIQSIARQQKIVPGWHNNDAIGLTTLDRDRVAEINISRRGCDDEIIRASVNGEYMPARRHSSFAKPIGTTFENPTNAAAAAAFAAGEIKTSLCHNNDQEQTTVEVMEHMADIKQLSNPSSLSEVQNPRKFPISLPDHSILGGPDIVLSDALVSAERPAVSASFVYPSDINNTITSSAGDSNVVSYIDYSRKINRSQRQLSERYLSTREDEVTELVDDLLSKEGFR
ncbi:potassium sodium hyperpolarization-activated cyclic nucleotide-gated [Plasmopara halstedii]|uniref:Potassium sodium hyperpolarization-activated cyclic nucleotide-gated n=1 Tax=Plasmopara halstedii TaxID=4781 RepID=A0A0P1ADH1_PLAHL|nr:potassium sodium hyperpolarization-activated cyclic nucleotide-gated [Plasmopara halstedii]CEG38634.1 potassium sodium hyperpolarization-activated cyclic nucleotide-gated [Plasmopara halstedii]|eukprot:XP_024575003.1 potassium sodium hyperpolarization-activated cyclic nucleotide-gated [Plasmopara halstedii]